MEWKTNARSRPENTAAFQIDCENSGNGLGVKPIHMLHGKPLVTRSHTRDFVEKDDDGNSSVVASINFRKGEYLFPKAYLHPKKRIVGETKDARLTDRGWAIYLDAVLRDKAGYPVVVDGCEIDMSGWYLESSLRDAGVGKDTIRIGATAPTVEDLEESSRRRARKALELERFGRQSAT